MRLGIYGGSFDPVHYGHLLLAECCREQCRLDEVWFMPAHIPPHKRQATLAPARQRVEMLQLAIGGHPPFRVCVRELEREGISYTVETLSNLRAERPEDALFLLLGADALADFATWREPRRIAELATLVSVRRTGVAAPDFAQLAAVIGEPAYDNLRRHQVVMPQVDFSSRDLRARRAAGLSIRYRTPRAVEQYLNSAGLYGSPGNERAPT